MHYKRIVDVARICISYLILWKGALLFGISLGLAGTLHAKTIPPFTIAVASNFQLPLAQVLSESPVWKNVAIRTVVGSSGSLYAQALKGAPFDMFLSADSARAAQLVQQGLAQSAATYAIGQLVIWPINSPSNGLYELNHLEGKLAIADPQLAPFGASAQAFISAQASAERLLTQIVRASNISQAFQFVDSGNAAMGILAKSSLLQAHIALGDAKYLHFWSIPQENYAPIVQQLVIFNKSVHKQQALAVKAFLLNDNTQQKLHTLGYGDITGFDTHD